MVVAVGVTVNAVPLVAAMLPGVITAVPPENTPVRVALDPVVIVAGEAAKLVIDGAGTAVMVAVCVADVPAALVTVRV